MYKHFSIVEEGASEEASGGCEISSLKKQVKEQGQEIVILKSALADALRRLQVLEERKHHASGKYLAAHFKCSVSFICTALQTK